MSISNLPKNKYLEGLQKDITKKKFYACLLFQTERIILHGLAN